MRRTPDKDTIIKLRNNGLTMAEIGKMYGVTQAAISWAYHYEPKVREIKVRESKVQDGIIPPHVIAHWRYSWGWSEAVIRQHVTAYARDIAKRGVRQ